MNASFQLPLPELIFCPPTPFSSNLINLTRLDEVLGHNIDHHFEFDRLNFSWPEIALLLRTMCHEGTSFHRLRPQFVDSIDFGQMLKILAPTDFISKCKIGTKTYDDCSPFFQFVPLESGGCYAFNLLNTLREYIWNTFFIFTFRMDLI